MQNRGGGGLSSPLYPVDKLNLPMLSQADVNQAKRTDVFPQEKGEMSRWGIGTLSGCG